MMVFLHAALFVVLSSFRTTSVVYLLHASFHLRFGRILLLFPGMSTSSILLTMCSSFVLLTWLCHFSRFSVILLEPCTTLVDDLMCSFRMVTLLVTTHIHISILISFTSSRACYPLVVSQVYAVYNRAALTQFCKLFPSVSLASSCHTTLLCISFLRAWDRLRHGLVCPSSGRVSSLLL